MTPRYRVERVIGRGRHASLWLAMDKERSEPVVLKIAPRGSLQREYDTLRSIDDEHVVKARECGVLPDGRPFIAMAYLSRGDVAHVRVTPETIEAIVHDAALALAAVHRAGRVHRDIKPAHLLIRGDAQVALCDFGSAARIGTRGEQTAPCVIGTPRYASPEQIEGAPAAPAADAYSFGICLFELLAGRPPFRGETLTELFSQHLRAPVPRLPREAAHWQALVDALLAKDPAQRPVDGDALLTQLSVLTGEVM